MLLALAKRKSPSLKARSNPTLKLTCQIRK
nr:MAG TPA: hypothetical protein [Caudoviricetes sp.]